MKIQKKCTIINFFSLLLILFWSSSLKDHPHTFFFIYLTLYFLGHSSGFELEPSLTLFIHTRRQLTDHCAMGSELSC